MREQLLRWGFLALVFAIPLGTKKFLFSFATPFTNFYTSEYTAAFLFGSDLLLLAALLWMFFAFPQWRSEIREARGPAVFLAVFAAFAALSLLAAPYLAFGAYALLRLFGVLAAGFLAWWVVRRGIATPLHIAAAFGASAVFQAIVAVLQFSFQKSVGLWWLGETVALGPGTPGVAGIAVGGLSFLRAYGTLPHANLLAGFLVLGLLALSYLFLSGRSFAVRIFSAAGIVVVLAGLLVSFSRSGWIVALFAFGGLFIFMMWRRMSVRRVLLLALVVVV